MAKQPLLYILSRPKRLCTLFALMTKLFSVRTQKKKERREGIVSQDMANVGIGLCGSYDVPLEIRNDCVPSKVITQIRNWKAETFKYPVHPLTDLCKLSCKALLLDGCLHAPASDMNNNCYAFVKPRNTQKCAFIVDMRHLIEECTIKRRTSPLRTVADIFNKIEEMRRKGLVFGTTIDVTNLVVEDAGRGEGPVPVGRGGLSLTPIWVELLSAYCPRDIGGHHQAVHEQIHR